MNLRNLTIITFSLLACGLLLAASPVLSPPAEAATDVREAKMKAMNALTGRKFDYAVSVYKIRVEFLAEDRLRWTYLAAPDGEVGKVAEQSVDRRDIHYGIILLAWTEDDGTNVVDILDLQTMSLHANAVFPDGNRIFTEAAVTEVE